MFCSKLQPRPKKPSITCWKSCAYFSKIPYYNISDISSLEGFSGSLKVRGRVHRIRDIELYVDKLGLVSSASTPIPIDAEKTSLEHRLDHRVVDLRLDFSNSLIFRILSDVEWSIVSWLRSQSFCQIHTPKILHGSSEGGSAFFPVSYFEKPACLAQSPQLYKQMAICGDFKRVFEVGPIFRAEPSNTHRHLTEFTGIDVEMELNDGYSSFLSFVSQFLIFIASEISSLPLYDSIVRASTVEPLQVPTIPIVPFKEARQLLNEANACNFDGFSDFSFAEEKQLGKIVRQKYHTDVFILDQFPACIRPFYSMPSEDNRYCNAFDVLIRGEEVISGSQRIHCRDSLVERASDGDSNFLDANSLGAYLDAFKWGVPPHAGFGLGLERLVMQILGLNDIRRASMFPRDPKRILP
ncbi:aspartate-tRNA ligase-like protein [Mitosporidium daphniae]|uniref:Probable aspartate--tRNA ligase, cytoplasmic n=1 Tax=Mitosporidium daphniae TaxID=1485682 RepID=A0A098VNU5_9MICR|nr:aspartate-tRNA ligase-like protein [Mitosporidium daphniae]KGG50640.1 aspartate-tRNA ligase-like protein [Mitosporidium daphniae]|eukprot:XP_013237084.1 aspartate-tRNA ligase-like protein [Mitosporidium daphniae]